METRVYDLKTQYEEGLEQAAAAIREGKLVIFPTETVYGIGADAENIEAVRKIYEVKGRPQNNPLIAHICSMEMVERLAVDISADAYRLMDAFWPGPLTIVLKSSGLLTKEISAGLDTIAVRMPSLDSTRELIRRSGKVIVAPSANISGRPSGTSIRECMDDFYGRVPVMLDGGRCEIGLESTVVSMTGEQCVLLRPGRVTLEMLESVVGKVILSDGILNKLDEGTRVESPGMLYKHYSPKAKVTIVKGQAGSIANAVKSMYDIEEKLGHVPVVFCQSSRIDNYSGRRTVDLGNTKLDVAHNLFYYLREADREGITSIYFEDTDGNDIGLAIRNRIFRAAGFDILDADKEEEIEKHIACLYR